MSSRQRLSNTMMYIDAELAAQIDWKPARVFEVIWFFTESSQCENRRASRQFTQAEIGQLCTTSTGVNPIGSRRSLQRQLYKLEEVGLIASERRQYGMVYTINFELLREMLSAEAFARYEALSVSLQGQIRQGRASEMRQPRASENGRGDKGAHLADEASERYANPAHLEPKSVVRCDTPAHQIRQPRASVLYKNKPLEETLKDSAPGGAGSDDPIPNEKSPQEFSEPKDDPEEVEIDLDSDDFQDLVKAWWAILQSPNKAGEAIGILHQVRENLAVHKIYAAGAWWVCHHWQGKSGALPGSAVELVGEGKSNWKKFEQWYESERGKAWLTKLSRHLPDWHELLTSNSIDFQDQTKALNLDGSRNGRGRGRYRPGPERVRSIEERRAAGHKI